MTTTAGAEWSAGEGAADNLGEDGGGAEVGEVALDGEELDGGAAAEVVLEVRGDGQRHGHVLGRLHDDAGGADVAEHGAQVAVEHRPADEQRDVGPHVEQRPAELPHSRRHVRPHRQRREPHHPRLVVRLHRREHPLNLPPLEPPVVVPVVQEPSQPPPPRINY